MSEYQRCPRKWKYSYVDRLRPADRERHLDLGSLIHHGLAWALNAYYYSDYALTAEMLYPKLIETFDEWKAENRPAPVESVGVDGSWIIDDSAVLEFDEMVNSAAIITYRTIKHLDIPNNWRVYDGAELGKAQPYIEIDFDFPTKEYHFIGKIDAVMRNVKDNRLYVIDWKTRASFEDDESSTSTGEDFNDQIALYAYLLRSAGVPVVGECIYQILSKVPRKPEMLKNGKALSRAKITTDWETYKAAVEEAGFFPYEYDDMREKLANVSFWSPQWSYRSDMNLTVRFENFNAWVVKMILDKTYTQAYTRMCKLCPFNSICLSDDLGYDTQALIKDRFTYAY